jgi:hypothetical protein
MKTTIKALSAAMLLGAGLLTGTSGQVSLAHDDADDRSRPGGMMSGGSMMGESGGAGAMMDQGPNGMMGMMQQMRSMMKRCNEMMGSHGAQGNPAAPPSKPGG